MAGDLLGGGPALALCVWEPFGPSLVAPVSSGVALATGLARDFDEISVDLARKCADEGVELARAAGFDAIPLVVHRKPPRDEIVEAAKEHHARVVVVGNRGQGGRSPSRMAVSQLGCCTARRTSLGRPRRRCMTAARSGRNASQGDGGSRASQTSASRGSIQAPLLVEQVPIVVVEVVEVSWIGVHPGPTRLTDS